MSTRNSLRRARRALAVAAIATVTGSCADDPPSAVVGLTVSGCPPGQAHGTGILVEPDLILTSAHVVKGADEIAVTNGDRDTTATIAAFDPDMDLALLRVDTPLAEPRKLSDVPAGRDVDATAYVYRDGEVVTLPVRVRRPVRIHTEDIYIEGDTYRPGYELDADIHAGDSGGPVVLDGEVIGVLWARSSKYDARAYAIDPVAGGSTIREQLRTGTIPPTIDLTRCN